MATRLLVPLDGSDKDERAIAAAAAMAALSRSEVRLLHVVGPAIDDLSPRTQTMGGLAAAHDRLADAGRSLSISAARLAAISGTAPAADIIEGYDAAEILVERSAAEEVVVVVMATRAPGAAGLLLCGSVADRVIRESMRPVLVVPPPVDPDGKIELRRVLVPIDLSGRSVAVLDHLFALDCARQLEYTLLEVLPHPASESATLGSVADGLRARGARSVRERIVTDVDPAAAIIRVAREDAVDLVAIGTRGESGLRRFLLGGVVEDVVRRSETPILLLRDAPAA